MNSKDWRNATPEQLNFWNCVKGKIAWNTITPLYYQDAIAGSEFLTYNADKLYVALEVEFSAPHLAPSSNVPLVAFRNEADVALFSVTSADWEFKPSDDTATYYLKLISFHNIYFSRIEVAQFSSMRFNGYRLNV